MPKISSEYVAGIRAARVEHKEMLEITSSPNIRREVEICQRLVEKLELYNRGRHDIDYARGQRDYWEHAMKRGSK